MAGVFLSYVHQDSDKARSIARTLEKAGHKVWWDRFIKGGAEYCDEIEAELKKADFVVVLWSERSVHSAWVRDEAAAGRDDGRLIPLSLDRSDPPLGFRQFQTIDLNGWKGHGEARLRPLLDALSSPCGEPMSASYGSGMSGPWPPMKRALLLAAMVAIVAATFAAWIYSRPPSSIPLVAIHAAEPSGPARASARDLLVKLGSLHSSKSDKLRLVGADQPADNADLVFMVDATGQDPQQSANLALLAGKDRSLLWSKEFQAQGGNPANIRQSMAYTAGQVLECALEEAGQEKSRLDLQTLKLFLNGCAIFAERYRSDPASVVPIFSQLVKSAPRFEPAWSKLLLAEAQKVRGQMLFYDRFVPGLLPQHIRTAREFNPRMPELYLAQIALLPYGAWGERLRLIDEAIKLNPDNPDLRVSRCELFSTVGRNNDAVDDARRAVEINPLSSGFRSNLIQILAYSGQLAAAEEELRRAEKLWPGSPTTEDARFRFTSRFGDPKEALRMLQSPDFKQYYSTHEMGSYLQARISPTNSNVQLAIAASQGPQLSKNRKYVQLAQLLADFGRNEEIYELFAKLDPDGSRMVASVTFRPAFAKFRQDPRFIQVAAQAGLIGFWHSTGKWPDFCFEPKLRYDCKAEAAKFPLAKS